MPFSRPTFMGASLLGVNTSIGWNGNGSNFSVKLVEDPSNGDSFSPGTIGGPTYLSIGSLVLNGIFKKYTQDKDKSGNPTYTCEIADPRTLLDMCKIITADYGLFVTGIFNLFNVYAYYENTFGYGTSEVNDSGMPWQLVQSALTLICNGGVYTNFGGPITYRGFTYSIDISALPQLPTYFRVGGHGQGLSILEFIQICCESASFDFFFQLVANAPGSATNATIVLKTVPRMNVYPLGTIAATINSSFAGSVIRSSVGLEERDETTSVFLIGGDVHLMWETPGTDNDSFWGFAPDGTPSIGGVQKYVNFSKDGSVFYSFPVRQYTIYINDPQIASISGLTYYVTNDLELMYALGMGQAKNASNTWRYYLKLYNSALHTLLVGTNQAANIQPPAGAPNIPRNMVNANGQRVQAINAAVVGAVSTDGEARIQMFYEWLLKYARDYYGKQYAIYIPNVLRKTDTDTGEISYSHEISDGGWVDELGDNDLSGLPTTAYHRFQTADGRYVAFVRFDGENADVSKINPANQFTDTVTNNIYMKCSVDRQLYFNSAGEAYAIVSVDPIYDYPDSIVGFKNVVGAISVCDTIQIQNAGGIDDGQGQQRLNQLMQNRTGQTVGYVSSPQPRIPTSYQIPIKNNSLCYGPFFAQGNSGRVRYEQDSSLVPWNYNGFVNMVLAGVAKAQQGISFLQVVESGYVEVVGEPIFNLGDVLQANGTNITSISVNVGEQGVTTTYRLETYVPRPAQIGRYNLDLIRKQHIAGIKYINETKARMDLFNLNAQVASNAATTAQAARPFLQNFAAPIQMQSPNPLVAAQTIEDDAGNKYPVISTTTYDEVLGLIPFTSGTSYQGIAFSSWEGILSPFGIYDNTNTQIPCQEVPTYTDSDILNGYNINPWKDNTVGFACKIYGKNVSGAYSDANDYAWTNNPASSGVAKQVIGLRGPVVIAGWGRDYNGNQVGSINDYTTHKVGPLDTFWDDNRKVWSVHDLKKGITSQQIYANLSGYVLSYQKDNASDSIFAYNYSNDDIPQGEKVLLGYVADDNRWYIVRNDRSQQAQQYTSGQPSYSGGVGQIIWNNTDKTIYISDGSLWYTFCPCNGGSGVPPQSPQSPATLALSLSSTESYTKVDPNTNNVLALGLSDITTHTFNDNANIGMTLVGTSPSTVNDTSNISMDLVLSTTGVNGCSAHDTFTASNGTLLENHTADSGQSWTTQPTNNFTINSNAVSQVNNSTGNIIAVIQSTKHDGTVEVDVTTPSSGTFVTGLLGQYDISTQDGIYYRMANDGTTCGIYTFSGGFAGTLLATTTNTFTTSTTYTIKLVISGTTATAYVNGTLDCTATITAASNYYWGILSYNNNGGYNVCTLDNFYILCPTAYLTFASASSQYTTGSNETNLPTGASAWTLMLRNKTTSTNGDMVYLGTHTGLEGIAFMVHSSAFAVEYGVFIWTGGSISDGNWHTCFVVYDGATMSLWVDGTQVQSFSVTMNLTYTGTEITFGKNISGNGYYDGKLMDVRIWNTNLGSTDIATLTSGDWNTTISTTPVRHWKCDEGSGTTCADSSTNSDTQHFAAGSNAPTWS